VQSQFYSQKIMVGNAHPTKLFQQIPYRASQARFWCVERTYRYTFLELGTLNLELF
jgi:hypothetical protein